MKIRHSLKFTLTNYNKYSTTLQNIMLRKQNGLTCLEQKLRQLLLKLNAEVAEIC